VGIFSVIRKPLRLAKLELVVRQACKASMVRRLAVADESGSSGLHKA
jgi:phosphoribosylaminoimidazole-succinocarboxamide synthase